MLRQALILAIFCLFVVNCQYDQLFDPWNQRTSYLSKRLDREDEIERDREPLDPNYRDPITSGTEEKPILKPKKQTPKPASFNPSVLPGGVIDVDAHIGSIGGFSTFPEISDPFKDTSFGFPGSLSLGGFFNFQQYKPWWQGDHVCIEREEVTDDEDEDGKKPTETATEQEGAESTTDAVIPEKVPNFFSTAISLSNCQETPNKYECVTKVNNHGVVKTFTVRYKCCYGYVRTKGGVGCEKKADLKSLMDTIQDMEATEFKKLIEETGLQNRFTDGNYTLFVPTNEALNLYNDKIFEMNNVDRAIDAERRRRQVQNALSSNDLVLSHAVAGFVDLSDLSNEDIIYSENKNESIRINVFPTQTLDRLVTVNCAPVVKSNNFAENGIVHMLSRVAIPPTHSVLDIIREHPKLSTLRQVLENTELIKKFKDDGHYTIFAPTDDAFNKLESNYKQKLLRGDGCAANLLQNIIVSHTICSAAIQGNVTTHNVEGEILNLERTADDKLIIEGSSKITQSDIMGTNGVIHLIDSVVIPESSLHISAILKKENLTKFYDLIEKAGLTDEIDSLKNATVFAPSDEALEEPETKKLLDEIQNDSDKLRDLIRYHTLPNKLKSCDMNNDAMIKTNDHDQELRLNLYSTFPIFTNVIDRATINCARITGFDEKSCGSVIHEVNKFLVPPKEDILSIIRNNEKYSTLNKVLQGTEVEKFLEQSNISVTFLAPTDETFQGVPEEDLKTLYEDKEKADTVLRNHILKEVLCCSGVGQQAFSFKSLVPTISDQYHHVGRSGNNQIRIGRAVVTSCDNLATNGVVHAINKVLFPGRGHNVPGFGGFFVFDF